MTQSRNRSMSTGRHWATDVQLFNHAQPFHCSVYLLRKGCFNCQKGMARRSQSDTTVQREGRCIDLETKSTTTSCSNCSDGNVAFAKSLSIHDCVCQIIWRLLSNTNYRWRMEARTRGITSPLPITAVT